MGRAEVMRILVISAVSPNGPSQGERLRLENLMRGAGAAGDVELWQVDPAASSASRFAALWRTRSVYWARNAFTPRSIPAARYDLVIAFQLRTAPLAKLVQSRRRIIDLTDSLGLFRQRLKQFRTGFVRQIALAGIGNSEAEWSREFDEVWVSGWQDAQWLRNRGVKAWEVANAVREKVLLPPGNPRELLFVGNLAYLPNRQGLQRFLRQVWPALAKEQYRLHIAGQGSGSMRGPQIISYGFAQDLLALYRKTGISISPVELGTGTQNKILEALGYGRPVVSGPAAAAALPAPVRAGVAVAADIPAWGQALRDLQDPVHYRQWVTMGWEAVPVAGEPVTGRLQCWGDW